jgi:hypothetical protein
MPRIFRVWIDIDEYDPATDEWTDVPANFGPTAAFVAIDTSEPAIAHARQEALAFAERLHQRHLMVDQDQDVPA